MMVCGWEGERRGDIQWWKRLPSEEKYSTVMHTTYKRGERDDGVWVGGREEGRHTMVEEIAFRREILHNSYIHTQNARKSNMEE